MTGGVMEIAVFGSKMQPCRIMSVVLGSRELRAPHEINRKMAS